MNMRTFERAGGCALVLGWCVASSACDDPQYRVGGEVVGLDGTGLVLQLGEELLPVDGDGPFSFAGRLPGGDDFQVLVATQPSAPAQVCTVSGGEGTVRGTVDTVVVDCVTPPLHIVSSDPAADATNVPTATAPRLTFNAALGASTLAGAFRLLDGSDLVPTTQSTPDAASVVLQPTQRLALLTPYRVEVDASLRGLYGEAPDPATGFTFTTRDGQFHPAATFAANPPNPQDASVVPLSGGGFVAAWYQYDGAYANVYVRVYDASSGWSAATVIDTATAGDANQPALTADGSGHAYLTWVQSNGGRGDVFGARFTEGGAWDVVTQVSDGAVGSTNSTPSIGVNDAGDAVVAWVNTASTDDSVFARIYPRGGATPGAAQRIELSAGMGYLPRAFIDDAAVATVVFANAGSTVDLWAVRNLGSTWSEPVALEQTAESVSEFDAKITESGDVFVAFTQQIDSANQTVFARRLDASGTLGALVDLQPGVGGTGYTPRLAVSATGSVLCGWGRYPSVGFRTFTSRYEPATGWAPAIDGPANSLPVYRLDAHGNGLAMWQSEVGTTSRIVRWSRLTAAGWSAPVTLTPEPDAYAERPTFAVDAYGGAVALWNEYEFTSNQTNIMWARFDDLP